MYDYLIVGAGIYGASFARMATDAGKKCLVIDRRDHIAGNVYDERVEGILVNRYGGHIWHCNSEPIWRFVNRFSDFTQYEHRVKVSYRGQIFSFPINLLTFNQLWGDCSIERIKREMERMGTMLPNPTSFEQQVISQVGARIYETLFEGYTKKQWGREPRDLPASIAKRIPIRLTYDDRYFSDKYQGMPTEGYTEMVWRMLDGIEVQLDTPFESVIQGRSICEKTVYSGPLDALFDYRFGKLEYRSLRFEHETHEGDFQGCATINYTDEQIPYTRIIEWKHFRPDERHDKTIITREFPSDEGQPYYPIADSRNRRIYNDYLGLVPDWMLVGGRLGSYQYLNMDQAIGMAMKDAKRELT
jgi:UDP-galactopyranose mutase